MSDTRWTRDMDIAMSPALWDLLYEARKAIEGEPAKTEVDTPDPHEATEGGSQS